MSEDGLIYNEYGARQPTAEYEGELPLSLYTNGANILITDANGVEIVPFMPQDFTEEPGVEMVPSMAKSLKRYYEEPEKLVAAEADYFEGRLVYGDDEGEEEMWFTPGELSPESTSDEESRTEQIQFILVVDNEVPWPDDIETKPDHEVRIEDSEGNCWYQMRTAECDATYTETPDEAVENASDLIENIRLAYEHPEAFARHHE